MGKCGCNVTGDEAKVFVENLEYLNLECDTELIKQLVRVPKGSKRDHEDIGMVLVSPVEICVICYTYGKTEEHLLSYMMILLHRCLLFTTLSIVEKKVALYSNTMVIIHRVTVVKQHTMTML